MNDFRVIIAARNFYKYTTLKEGVSKQPLKLYIIARHEKTGDYIGNHQ